VTDALTGGLEMTTLLYRLRGTLLALTLLSLVVVLGACGREGLAGTGLAPPSASRPSMTAPTSAAVPPRCGTGQLHLVVAPAPNAAGHIGLLLMFTNTSNTVCSMFGYPGVSFLTSAGVQINDGAQRSAALGAPSLVALPPGGRAHANLLLVNVANYVGNPNCQPTLSARVRVYPPDETTALFASSAQQICEVSSTGVPVVYPVQTGATSS
jgi:hypothetical protein